MEQVTVRVPATSANIGPGFDSLGLALSLYCEIGFSRLDAGALEIRGCDNKYANDQNLAYVAFKKVYEKAGVPLPGIRLDIKSDIPVSRGLGSSAAMIVAGVCAANAMLEYCLSAEELLAVATRLEGHPDNVAPALLGGFTASLLDHGAPKCVSLEISEKFKFCALIPDFETQTHEARRLLPVEVDFADAVFNVSHTAVLIGALARGDVGLVRASLEDRLHQPYRKSMIAGFEEVKAAAQNAGAAAFFISGAGPTCMCLLESDGEYARRMSEALQGLKHKWSAVLLDIDRAGARIVGGGCLEK
ncbi:MAG: homoserine kinase [Oscillospiraceae bacterium]